jgi:hypothetical protein
MVVKKERFLFTAEERQLIQNPKERARVLKGETWEKAFRYQYSVPCGDIEELLHKEQPIGYEVKWSEESTKTSPLGQYLRLAHQSNKNYSDERFISLQIAIQRKMLFKFSPRN